MELVGLVAGCCTTLSFVPQVVQTWKSKSVEDISLKMYLLLCFGLALWLVYGFLTHSLSVIVANAVTFVLAFCVLGMKCAYRTRSKKSQDKGA